MVVLGLPFAVTVGWMLGAPVADPPAAAARVSAAGGLGAAPTQGWTSKPVTPVEFANRPARPWAGATSVAPPSVAAASPLPSTSAPVPGVSASPLPSLTVPPVPTPTEILIPPDSPSATPSSSATPKVPHVDATRSVPRP
jgi:hypothetical protein